MRCVIPYLCCRIAAMLLIPEDILETLEFHKVRELTAERCVGEPGRDLALRLRPLTDVRSIRHRLQEVDEWFRSQHGLRPIPFSAYEDISTTFPYLEVEDYILDAEDLLRIRVLLQIHQSLHDHVADPEWAEQFPVLTAKIQLLPWDEHPLDELNAVFTETGELRSDASPELAKIRSRIEALQRALEKQFRQMVGEYRKKGWLSDAAESVRNGRLVLIVPVEHKRKIKGIIHDESGTGRTVFLEPDQLVELNNDLFDLESEERQEIQRILRGLCNRLRPHLDYFQELSRYILRLDLIRAKALVADLYRGTRPEIVQDRQLELKGAFHPLLWVKNSAQDKPVVPFDLTLDQEHRVLVLSGPNAGGKSITMKTVLLVQFLAQSGFLIPAQSGSRLPAFQKCFADIGDQQSIEDDLSTYSSKLQNMRRFLAEADRRTLIALDEFGSGTDPKIGGAIAQAILRELHRRKVMGVVTTHYSNLKIFAFKTPGLLNGSMVFDQERLQPTYELRVGHPGSSYAFEIATSSGLPEETLAYARKLTGESEQAVDRLLVNLQSDRKELEDRLQRLQDRERKVDQLMATYDRLLQDLEYQRKKQKMTARELALQQKSMEKLALDDVIQELKEERNLEKAKAAREALRQEQERLRHKVRHSREEVQAKESEANPEELKIAVGHHVKIRGGGAVGEILRLEKQQAEVLIGDLKMVVDIRDLEPVRAPLEVRTRTSVQHRREEPSSIAQRLDIRGFKVEEALKTVEIFLDNALMGSASKVHILHGKGSGALRKAVYQKAREYRDVKRVVPALPEEGGDGVTLIYFQ